MSLIPFLIGGGQNPVRVISLIRAFCLSPENDSIIKSVAPFELHHTHQSRLSSSCLPCAKRASDRRSSLSNSTIGCIEYNLYHRRPLSSANSTDYVSQVPACLGLERVVNSAATDDHRQPPLSYRVERARYQDKKKTSRVAVEIRITGRNNPNPPKRKSSSGRVGDQGSKYRDPKKAPPFQVPITVRHISFVGTHNTQRHSGST